MARKQHGGSRAGAGRPKGRPVKRLVLLLPEEVYAAVKADAAKNGLTINKQIREHLVKQMFLGGAALMKAAEDLDAVLTGTAKPGQRRRRRRAAPAK
jgi:hypothetical protein